MWIEFVDFDRMKTEQKQLSEEWNKSLFRDCHFASSRVMYFIEDVNTLGNMIDRYYEQEKFLFNIIYGKFEVCFVPRLKTYDKKLPLPDLMISPSIVPVIPREKFLNKSQMLDALLEYFRILTQFSR